MRNRSYGRVFNSFQELYNAGNNPSPQYWDEDPFDRSEDPFDRSDEYVAPQPTAGQQMKTAMGNFGAGIRGVGQAAKTAMRKPIQTAKEIGRASGRGLRTVGRAAKRVGQAVNRGLDKFVDKSYDVVTDPFGRARQAERDLMKMSRAGTRAYFQGEKAGRASAERARKAWADSMRWANKPREERALFDDDDFYGYLGVQNPNKQQQNNTAQDDDNPFIN